MATQEEVRRLIGGLPTEVGKAIFVEVSLELRKLADWSTKVKAFGEEIGDPPPGDPSFADALRRWEEDKSLKAIEKLVEKVMAALKDHYGRINVTPADVKDYINNMNL